MKYTKGETDDWRARFGNKLSFKLPKRTSAQLPGMISVTDAFTGEVKLVKPVRAKVKTKVRKHKKKTIKKS